MSNTNITLSKTNYSIIILGCIIVIIGFIFMSGGGTDDPAVFNEDELFSFRRITLAPFLTVLGYMVVLFGVLKRAKISTSSNEVSKKESDGVVKK
jgi:uncharacterized membrane protein